LRTFKIKIISSGAPHDTHKKYFPTDNILARFAYLAMQGPDNAKKAILCYFIRGYYPLFLVKDRLRMCCGKTQVAEWDNDRRRAHSPRLLPAS
jgi:hypothetical protein